MSPRASALPPSERRVAIVRSALDLIRERGTAPTTREIADAAGVAEGTLFRAFDTKERLMEAIAAEAFCPAPIADQFLVLDEDLSLRDRMIAFVTVLQDRFSDIFVVMDALGLTSPPTGYEEHRGCSAQTGHVMWADQDPEASSWESGRHQRMVSYVQRDAAHLTCSPADLIRYLRLMTFSGSHPDISEGRPLAPAEIVDVVLGGVLTPGARPAFAPATPATHPTQTPTRSRKAR